MSEEWTAKQLHFLLVDFDQADKNKDGSLSFREVMQILRAQGFNGAYSQAMQIFKFLDDDGDRKVSREEFSNLMKKLPKMTLREFAMRKIFVALDLDRSGYLTENEVYLALLNKQLEIHAIANDNIVSDIMAAISKDEDGKLNYEELLREVKVENEVVEMRLLFKKLDSDGSGFLTRKEISKACNDDFELQMSLYDINNLITQLMKDDDAKFSYEEFIKAWCQVRGTKRK